MARVLVVDDEDLVRKVVRVVLEAEGHTVVEAGDGQSALDALSDAPAEAVVLDLMIPGMDGYEVCRRVKDADPHQKVLVLTAMSEDESVVRAREAGADDVMTKPFSALELLDRLQALLGS
jgi:DNA-binding response OmpR family regulator